jgi:ubiquinone/menaquinone biosynthesis C-methylase UbiE
VVHNPAKIFGPYVRPGMTVLDVGCGAGFTTIALARLVGEEGQVVAVDLQQEMLDMLERRAARANLTHRIRLHKCQADALGVEGQYDFVNAFWMVHEVPDIPGFLAETSSLLRPGGHLLVAEPLFHVSSEDLEKVIELAENIGLSVSARPRITFSRSVAFVKS